MENPVIIVDSREIKSGVCEHLKRMKADVQHKNLDVGDYLCSDRVVCERKTVSDFLQSITNQRIFRQAESMHVYEKPVMIIEGNGQLFAQRDIHPNTIRGVLASIAIDYSIPIIWTRDGNETASQIYWIANREQILEKRPIQIRPHRKTNSIPGAQEFLVAGLPGISNTMTKRLLEHFKTPKKLFNAKVNDLMKVDKIGKTKAEKIREILDSKY
ncbi:MAG: ERCC4 domain-containing protein [Candidatus Aenigmatarchaeota archaeon]|nr:hypothetical protein [Nanoarchaeota archaeon]